MKQQPHLQEQACIRRILGGQAGEYAYFVEHYKTDVLSLIQRMGIPAVEAEELAQDTFLRAFRGLKTFEGKAAFRTWLLRIAHRVTLNSLQRKRPYLLSLDDDNPRAVHVFAEAELEATLDAELDAALSTGREERIQQLEAAIQQLPPEDQLLLRLYYYEELPLAEIAFILDSTPNALSARLHRLRRKLYRMIGH